MSAIIKSKDEVEAFIRQFKPKMDVWGIFFIGRGKNLDAAIRLNLRETDRKEILRNIVSEDYVETIIDALSYGEMWVFGKDFNDTELYIKISLGRPNNKTICISFHEAEHPINYALKNKEDKQ
ncbi:MAG: toxin [Parabacteroides sp.]|nr:toxin [Parabacteroides sp.]